MSKGQNYEEQDKEVANGPATLGFEVIRKLGCIPTAMWGWEKVLMGVTQYNLIFKKLILVSLREEIAKAKNGSRETSWQTREKVCLH